MQIRLTSLLLSQVRMRAPILPVVGVNALSRFNTLFDSREPVFNE